MILMYHHVSPVSEIPEDPARCGAEGWAYHTTPETLSEHISFLRRRRHAFVPYSDYVAAIRRNGCAPRRAVTVTFDDGWLDNISHALPVLQAESVPAIFFLVSGELPSVPSSSFAGPEGIRALLDAGMEIGGHTRTHRPLAMLKAEEAAEEILGSVSDLEARHGASVRHFAYPGGSFNRSVARIAEESGILESACSILPGPGNRRQSLYWLHRETVAEPWDTAARFRLANPAWRMVQSIRSRARLGRKLNLGADC